MLKLLMMVAWQNIVLVNILMNFQIGNHCGIVNWISWVFMMK